MISEGGLASAAGLEMLCVESGFSIDLESGFSTDMEWGFMSGCEEVLSGEESCIIGFEEVISIELCSEMSGM